MPSLMVLTGKIANWPAAPSQHEMLDVSLWDEHTLRGGEASIVANIEKALNLLIDAADGLDLAVLIDRPGHR